MMDFRIRHVKHQQLKRDEDPLIIVLKQISQTVKAATQEIAQSRQQKKITIEILNHIKNSLIQKEQTIANIQQQIKKLSHSFSKQTRQKNMHVSQIQQPLGYPVREQIPNRQIAKNKMNPTEEKQNKPDISSIGQSQREIRQQKLNQQNIKKQQGNVNHSFLTSQQLFLSKIVSEVEGIKHEIQNLSNNRKQIRNIPLIIRSEPFPESGSSRGAKIKEFIAKSFHQIFSVSFNMYYKQKVDFQKVKAYCSQNILSNFIELTKKNKISPQEIEMIDSHLGSVVLPFLKQSYPHSEQKEVSKNLRARIAEKDIFNQNRFDIIFNSPLKKITWHDIQYENRNDKNNKTIKEVMQIANFIIGLPDQKINEDKQQSATLYEKFQEQIYQIFEMVKNRPAVDLLYNAKTQFREKFKQMKTPETFSIAQILQNILGFTTKRVQEEGEDQKQQYSEKVKSYTKYKIGRKISSNVPTFSKQEIERTQMKIKDSSIRRILTKWTQSLAEVFDNAAENNLIRNQFLMLNDGSEYKNQTLQDKQYLLNHLQKQSLLLLDEQKKIKSNEYKLFHEVISNNDSGIFQQFCDEKESQVAGFCTLVSRASQNYVVNHIKMLINKIKSIQNDIEAFSNSGQRTKNQKQILLVNLKLGDLMRCQISSKQKQIIAIYQFICLLADLYPNIFELVRVKNRFNGPNKDILINLWYRQRIMVQIQLAIKNESTFLQCSDKYSHFIYELTRVFLGPISQLVNVWINNCPKAQFFNKKLISRRNKKNEVICKQKMHHFRNYTNQLKLPFWCSFCGQFISNIEDRSICEYCENVLCRCCNNLLIIENQYPQRIELTQDKLKTGILLEGIEVYSRQQKKYFICKLMGKLSIFSFYFKDQTNQFVNFKKVYEVKKYNSNKKMLEKFVEENYIFNLKKQREIQHKFKADLMTKIIQNYWNQKIQQIGKKKVRNLSVVISSQPILGLQHQQQIFTSIMNNKALKIYYAKIQKIFASELGLTSLQALRILEGITDVNLKNNRIKSLAGMTVLNELVNLDLRFNLIPNFIGMPILENLEFLYLCSNSISSFEFIPNLPKLKILDASQNKINSFLHFPKFEKLRQLLLNQNKLVSFAHLPQIQMLQRLYIDANNIESFENFPIFPSLIELSADINKLCSLAAMPQLPNLQLLKLQQNLFINFKGMPILPSLKNLYLGYSIVQSFTGIPSHPKLEKLIIASKKLPNFEQLPNLPSLQLIEIQKSGLTQMKGLRQLKNVKKMIINKNFITNFQGMQQQIQLQILSITKNQVASFLGMPNLSNLKMLQLSQNKLLSFEFFPNLQNINELNLRKNKITSFKNFPNLRNLNKLFLSQNAISSFEHMPPLDNLLQLQILFNQITSFKFLPTLPKIKVMDVSFNRIEGFQGLHNMENLQTFMLNENLVHSFVSLPPLPKLKKLGLWSNRIKNFAYLPKLAQLQNFSLLRNMIQSFQGFSQLRELKQFLVGNGPYILENLDLFKNCRKLKKLQLNELSLTKLKENQEFRKLRYQVFWERDYFDR